MADVNPKIILDVEVNSTSLNAADQKLNAFSRKQMERQRNELTRLNYEMLADAQGSGRTGIRQSLLGGSSFRTIGMQLRAIPGGGIPETVGRLSPIADVLTDLAERAPGASIGLVAFTGGLVALSFVIQQTSEQLRKATEERKRQIDLERKYQREARELADVGIRQRLADIDRQLALEQQALEEAQQAADVGFIQKNQVLLGRTGGIIRSGVELIVGGEARDATANADALRQAYVDQAKVVNELTTEQLELNRTLLNNSNVLAELDSKYQQQLELDKTTLADREEMIQQNNQEIRILNELYAANTGNAESQEYLRGQMQKLFDENRLLGDTFDTTADQVELMTRDLELFNNAVQYQINFQDMDKQERADRIAEIQREIAIWKDFRDNIANSKEETQSARDAIDDLSAELTLLGQIASTNADVLKYVEGLQDNINDSTDAYFDNLQQQTEEAEEASERWIEAQRDNAQELADIQAEADAKWAEALLEAEDRRAEIEEDHTEKRIKAEEDYQKRIDKINRDANEDIIDAIGNRDALAAFQAERRRQKELADEAEAQAERLEDIEDAYKEQQETIQEYLDDQQRKIQQAADRARETQARRFAEEQRLYQQFQQQQIANVKNNAMQLASIQISGMQDSIFRTNNYYMTALSIQDVYQNASLFRLEAWWNGVMNTFSGGTGVGNGGSGGSIGNGGGITPFSAGGRNWFQNAVRQETVNTIAELGRKATGRR